MADEITQQLVRLLKLPKNAVQATLELRSDAPPQLTVTLWALELDQQPVSRFELRPLEPDVAGAAGGPFDLDAAIAKAHAQIAEFIASRTEHHLSALRCSFSSWRYNPKRKHLARVA